MVIQSLTVEESVLIKASGIEAQGLNQILLFTIDGLVYVDES